MATRLTLASSCKLQLTRCDMGFRETIVNQITISDVEPVNPAVHQLWLDTDPEPEETSIEIQSQITVSPDAPLDPTENDLWLDIL